MKFIRNFYVYYHINSVTKKIFYVGKGNGKRAYTNDRNNLWKAYVKKHAYEIQMVKENLTEYHALKLENKLIIQHWNNGDLVNIKVTNTKNRSLKKRLNREALKKRKKKETDDQKVLREWIDKAGDKFGPRYSYDKVVNADDIRNDRSISICCFNHYKDYGVDIKDYVYLNTFTIKPSIHLWIGGCIRCSVDELADYLKTDEGNKLYEAFRKAQEENLKQYYPPAVQ